MVRKTKKIITYPKSSRKIREDIKVYNARYFNNMTKKRNNNNFINDGDTFLCPYCEYLLNTVLLTNCKNKSLYKTNNNYVIIKCEKCNKPFILKKENAETFKISDDILAIEENNKYKFVKATNANKSKYKNKGLVEFNNIKTNKTSIYG